MGQASALFDNVMIERHDEKLLRRESLRFFYNSMHQSRQRSIENWSSIITGHAYVYSIHHSLGHRRFQCANQRDMPIYISFKNPTSTLFSVGTFRFAILVRVLSLIHRNNVSNNFRHNLVDFLIFNCSLPMMYMTL
jgi:hypothetical protein